MTLFKNKYRIESNRLLNWDYSSTARYFITICTYKRQNLFGNIKDVNMHLNQFGKIVKKEWEASSVIRKEIFIIEFVVMPNHLHGIVFLKNENDNQDGNIHSRIDGNAETHGNASLHIKTGIAYRPPQSISSFIAGFKSSVTKQINLIRKTPGQSIWQTRFYDHVIRSEYDFNRIKIYIQNNPVTWKNDKYSE